MKDLRMKETNRICGRVCVWGIITTCALLLVTCAPRGTRHVPTPTTFGASTAAPNEAPTSMPLGEGAIIGVALWADEVPSLCPQMPQWGIHAANMWIAWDSFEPQKGRFDWTASDQLFSKMRSCGMAIGVHISSASSWGTRAWSGAQIPHRAMPPLNMQDYYDAVYALAERYKGQGIRYSIENEAAAKIHWGGTVDEYTALLKTGYQAIKAADPSAVVQHDGIISQSMFLMLAADMFSKGQQQQAVDYLNRGWADFPPGATVGARPIRLAGPAQFQELMQGDFGRLQLEWLDMLLANHQYYDVLQLHFHSPQVEMLPDVIEWFRQRMHSAGFDKPIEMWELGWSWGDAATLDLTKQAQAVPKCLGAAVGEGVQYMVYGRWSNRASAPGTEMYSLMSAQGPKPAAAAYQATALRLNGVTSAERLELPAGLWGYRYHKTGEEFYMVWRTQAGSGTVALPVGAASVKVTDLVTQATSQADPKSIPLGDDAILVEMP
jgi:hypothetical protein